jgi:hypothetical protein
MADSLQQKFSWRTAADTSRTTKSNSVARSGVVVTMYSPWINGLVEGTNKILLYVMARLCAPEVGEDGWSTMNWADLPKTWPDHFDEAIQILNWQILPALKFSPKELLLSLIVNTTPTPLEASSSMPSHQDFYTHMAYAAQQRLDGYSEAVKHAWDRKTRFDRRVLDSKEGEVVFEKGHLVQIFRSDVAKFIGTERKLMPLWSEPHRITVTLLLFVYFYSNDSLHSRNTSYDSSYF